MNKVPVHLRNYVHSTEKLQKHWRDVFGVTEAMVQEQQHKADLAGIGGDYFYNEFRARHADKLKLDAESEK